MNKFFLDCHSLLLFSSFLKNLSKVVMSFPINRCSTVGLISRRNFFGAYNEFFPISMENYYRRVSQGRAQYQVD